MKQRADCKAYQVSDQMTCPTCRLTWDMNDPEPPLCRQTDGADAVAQDHVEDHAPGWIKRALHRRYG